MASRHARVSISERCRYGRLVVAPPPPPSYLLTANSQTVHGDNFRFRRGEISREYAPSIRETGQTAGLARKERRAGPILFGREILAQRLPRDNRGI